MTGLSVILILAGCMLAVALLTVLSWFIYTTYLNRVERRLAGRKSLYRELVAGLPTRDRALLEQTVNQMSTLYDLDALEAVLEEQARTATGRPGWLVEVYDQLGLVDKYIERLRTARKWRDRAFAAELLGRIGGAKAVPVLLETVQATRTEDSDVREIALRALARIADPRAVEPLIRALATADTWLAPRIADILTRHGDLVIDPLIAVLSDSGRQPARAWAANVLGEVRAQRAFPALVRGLGDPEDEVRAKSATALGRLGDSRVVNFLLEHLLTDPAPFVRVRIACTLAQFGGPEVVDRLVRALGDPAWWVRMRSVEALEQIGSVAEGPLFVALDDPDPEIRVRAAVALERLGVAGELVRMIENDERVVEASAAMVKFAAAGARELLAELVLHPSSRVREAVVAAILRTGRRDTAPQLLQIAAGDPEAALRARAFETLRSLGVREAVPAALAGFTDPDQRVRAVAIELVGELGDAKIIDFLRAHIADPETGVRAAAARALGALGSSATESDLLRLLDDPKAPVRVAAVLATLDAGLRSLVPTLIELLDDSDLAVQREAARATGILGEPSVVPALLHVFPDAPPEVRRAIAVAVSRLDPGAVGAMIDTLADSPDVAGKVTLIRAIPRSGVPDTAKALDRLSHDSAAPVRVAALEALRRSARSDPGAGSVAVRAVARGLADPDDAVRATAVDGCSGTGEDHGQDLLHMLRHDPSASVRERAALAIGLLRVPGGEEALVVTCRRAEPANVRAAAALAVGAFEGESIVRRVIDMPDESTVRELLRQRLKTDSRFRLLGCRLSAARSLELRALSAPSAGTAQLELAEGLRGVLDAGERVRLIGSLRAFQGDQSRGALLQIVRGDPTPEVRTAALAAVTGMLEPDELLTVGARALGDPSALVRRAAVTLFARGAPDRALARLIQVMRVDDDPAVLATVAGLAEEHFPVFVEVALRVLRESDRAVLVVRIARHILHGDLAALLPPLARNAAPEVREAVAELWRQRPDIADPEELESLTMDPMISVRLSAAGAAAAAQRYDLLDRLTQDPDPGVRREVAIVLGRAAPVEAAGLAILERLSGDGDMTVRAAAYAARLLHGLPLSLPPNIDSQAVAASVLEAADLPALRDAARTASGEERRLAAALALALLQDDVAREVARTDPIPAIRHRVGGALELSMVSDTGAST